MKSPRSNQGAGSWAAGDLDKHIEVSEFGALHASEAKASKTEFAAYSALNAAFDKYRMLQLDLFEQKYGVGTSCGAMLIQEEARINYSFLITAEGFGGAEFRSFSASAFADSDAALNKAYGESMLIYPPTCATRESAD